MPGISWPAGKLARTIVVFLSFVALSPVVMAAPAGQFYAVIGNVKILDVRGKTRLVSNGDSLEAGDTIVTGSDSMAQLKLTDGARMSIRANTRFQLDQYQYASGAESSSRIFMRLLRGSFRSITGLIGRRNRAGYRIQTPHATIGVRGTDHETSVITPDLLKMQAYRGLEVGSYDRVNSGVTEMRTRISIVVIRPQQVGFVGLGHIRPRLLPRIPEALKRLEQPPAPTPLGNAIPGAGMPGQAPAAADGVSSDKVGSEATFDLDNPLRNPLVSTKATMSDSTKDSAFSDLPKLAPLSDGVQEMPMKPILDATKTALTPIAPESSSLKTLYPTLPDGGTMTKLPPISPRNVPHKTLAPVKPGNGPMTRLTSDRTPTPKLPSASTAASPKFSGIGTPRSMQPEQLPMMPPHSGGPNHLNK